jgi:Flp pilus assembly protein TadB
MPPGTCLICQTLEPQRHAELGSPPSVPGRRRRRSLGATVVAAGIAVVLAVLLVSWVVALAWTVIRLVELVAVAAVAAWVAWHLGVRHGRRHPR